MAKEKKEVVYLREDETIEHIHSTVRETLPELMHAVGLAIGELIKADVIAGDAEAVKRLHRASVAAAYESFGIEAAVIPPDHPLPLINGVLRAIDPTQPMWNDALEAWAEASCSEDE